MRSSGGRENGPCLGVREHRRLATSFAAWGLSARATLPRGRGRPRSEAQDLGLRPAAQLAPQRAFEVAAATTPDFLAGALACQSATSWRYDRSACSASSRSRRRTSLRLYPADFPLRPRCDGIPARSSSLRSFFRSATGERTRSPDRARSSSSTGTPACGRSRRPRSHPTTRADTLEERAQRPRCLDCDPRGVERRAGW